MGTCVSVHGKSGLPRNFTYCPHLEAFIDKSDTNYSQPETFDMQNSGKARKIVVVNWDDPLFQSSECVIVRGAVNIAAAMCDFSRTVRQIYYLQMYSNESFIVY